MPKPVIVELKKFREVGASPVFPAPRKPQESIGNGFRPFWDAALAESGINADSTKEKLVFHGLRHSCASFLAANGASLLEIGSVLGHQSLQSTGRYSHLCVSAKRNLVNSVFGEKLRKGRKRER